MLQVSYKYNDSFILSKKKKKISNSKSIIS